MSSFELNSSFKPSGDQEQAIGKLLKSLEAGNKHQGLLGVTGSGKTFTMANLIARMNRPTLVISHNKTLAAQLHSELKSFFPNNAVDYYVSYFDYYQPEAYIASSDTYIEKDSAINDELDRLSLNAMNSLMTRRDVIVVASVSCIYGLSTPEDYRNLTLRMREGDVMDRDVFLKQLVERLFERQDFDFTRGTFRVRGEVVEVFPAYSEGEAIRVEFFGDEVERVSLIDSATGRVRERLGSYTFFPAKQYVAAPEKRAAALKAIREELEDRVGWFEKHGRLLEAQRLKLRTDYDLELIEELGFCKGIENYSRHLSGRLPGSAPSTLLDFFPKDSLTLIDESHVAVPQLGGMYEGDRSRKNILVEHGFRLPSALDNRPLKFHEFMERQNQIVYASATPGPFELVNCRADNKTYIPVRRAARSGEKAPEGFKGILFTSPKDIRVAPSPSTEPVEKFDPTRRSTPLIVEQIIRPTGLLDPRVEVRPVEGQIDDLIGEINKETAAGNKVLVTTLTKRMAEDLTDYMKEVGIRVRYLHSDIDTLERTEIIRDMRLDVFDVLVGINLLREGLDIPEITLVAILDADKEGFLRSETSLVQTIGRAARNSEGHVIMYADNMTESMEKAISETERRRAIQEAYNREHGITPTTIKKAVRDLIAVSKKVAETEVKLKKDPESMNRKELTKVIAQVEKQMRAAAADLNFEQAAELRDKMLELKKNLEELTE